MKNKNFDTGFLTLKHEFVAFRFEDLYLEPIKFEISVELDTVIKKNTDLDILEKSLIKNHQKIYYWLDSVLQNSILVDVSNEEEVYAANILSNLMVYFPGKVNDFLFAKLLHSKLSALIDDIVNIGNISIKAEDSFLQYTYDGNDGNTDILISAEDYFRISKTKDKNPWWLRNDGFCFEIVRPDETDLTDDEIYHDLVDPLDEFEDIISDQLSERKEPAKIIQIDKWKPKKI